MALEATPNSVSTVGNLRIVFLPSSVTNPLSVASITGGTSKDITYSLTPSGWTPDISENSISDGRLAQQQILNRPGNFSESLEIEYVYGDANDVAKTALAQGVAGYFVVREGVANATAWAAGQKVDVFTILAGKQRKNPPAENSLFTMKQGMYLTAVTQRDATLVA